MSNYRAAKPALVFRRRPQRALVLMAAHLGFYVFLPLTVSAVELYNKDDVELRWDNTVTYSTAFRLMTPNPSLLADPNADDGDRTFRPGIISNRFDLLSQIDFSKAWFGFEASAAAWYDTVYNQKNDNNSPTTFNPISVAHNQFTHAVRTLHGADAELVNAFVYGNAELAGMPLSFRIGRQTLLWGESLFFTDNGIASGQAPVDETKVLGRPTAYTKDVFLPVAQASFSLQLLSNLTAEAYYQFEWRKTRLPGVGSYFSTADYLDAGGERYILPSGQYLFRDRDLRPPGSGQYGMALRWSPDQIDYGFYALRFDAKEPQIYYRPGVAFGSSNPPPIIDPSIVDLAIGKVGTYDLVYPQSIELYGASASGYLGSSNIAGEISGRRNMPLVSGLLIQLPGRLADGHKNPLYAVGDTIHAQMSTITTLAHTMLWDTATLNGEFAIDDILHVTRNRTAVDPSSDKFAMAFRGSFEPTYFSVLPNLDVTPSFGIGYNIIGNSSTDAYQNKGTGDFEFGIAGIYRVVWAANIMLSHFLGNANRQPLADRDFISFSIKRTF
jgi:hypothetical protein